MSKINDNKLVPKLRFPDFAKDKEWILNQLGKVYSFITTNSFSRDDLNYKNGDVKNIHYGDIHTKFSTLFNITKENVPFINESISLDKCKQENYCKEKDMIFADASEDLKDVGKSIELVNLNNEKLLSGLHTIHARQINDEIAVGFGGYLFLNENIRKQIQRESQGAKVLGISASRLSNISIFYPQKTTEQQKIVSCLSSLDGIITAMSQKLKVLKEHKKGLLQNLFPQEGETFPKLRFKEFENSGEWEETTLGGIGEPLMCKRIFKEETTPNPTNGVPFYKIGTFGRIADSYISNEIYEEYKSKYSFPKIGDILISASGTIGRLVIYDGSPAYFQDSNIIWLGHNEDIVLNSFLFYCYSNLRWQTSDGGVISRLYNSDFKRMKIKFPERKEEQEKIANTLSSIDDLISAQNQKLETLKLHKKGLLQGLFPTISNEE
jgi:type I restriction enzyme S subunit